MALTGRDKVEDIQLYYERNDEESRLDRQQLEFLLTWKALAKRLKPGSRILELGSGSGRYSVALAKAGHRVVASDLSPKLVESSRAMFRELGVEKEIELILSDARDIHQHVAGRKFDAVLVMGPLYHLVKQAERDDLMRKLWNLVDDGGHVVAAHMTRVGFVGYILQKYPDLILSPLREVQDVWEHGHILKHPKNGGFRGYWSTVEEARASMEKAGFDVVAVHAQDPGLGANDEAFNSLPEPIKVKWGEVLFALSEDPAAIGAARHFLCVGKKRGK